MIFGVGTGVGAGVVVAGVVVAGGGGSGFMIGNEHTIFCSGRGGTEASLLESSMNPLAS